MLEERLAAFKALKNFKERGTFLQEGNLTPFAQEIATGVCRRDLLLEYAVRKSVRKMPGLDLLLILEMGVYQIFFMDVPSHAALHTSVELVKHFRLGESSAKFVNGVLRNLQRNGLPELPQKRILKCSIENSVPVDLLRHWFDSLGPDKAEEYAKRHVSYPVWWLRADLRKTTLAKLAAALGIPCETYGKRYLKVPAEKSLKELLETREFGEGLFSVQNPAAADVVDLLDVKSGNSVWDACAAPGGKTALIAETAPDAHIFATDVSEKRLEQMQDLFTRLEIKNVNSAVIDASKDVPNTQFDRILLDVPCSNLGVIDKRPEAVYRANDKSLKELATLQYSILENAAKALKQGGILVYATCSPEREETVEIIKKFLAGHSDFKAASQPFFAGKKHPDVDRFFAQALRKV